MPMFLENFNLYDYFLGEGEQSYQQLCEVVVSLGTQIKGYYDMPYFNHHFGKVQVIVRAELDEEEHKIIIHGTDTHARGRAIWEVRLSGINICRPDADMLERRVCVKKTDGTGLAVVNLVNADVLPSFLEDDLVKMQMIGFPTEIHYYENEDQYAESMPPMRSGKKFLLDDGGVFPNGFLSNGQRDVPESERDQNLYDITNIRGTVTGLYLGQFQLEPEGKVYNPYILCTLDTKFGPLEIIHTLDQVDETEQDALHVGAIVNFYGTLSGDCAIDEYENGIVRDFDHALAALRYAFSGGDPERLRSILADDAEYIAEYNQERFCGADEIIKRIMNVKETNLEKQFAHFATLELIEDGEEELPYTIGSRCLALAEGEPNQYYAVAFVDVDDNGIITRIHTSVEPRYKFRRDPEPPRPSDFDDFELPKTLDEPMLARARFHGVIDEALTNEEFLASFDNEAFYLSKAQSLMAAMPEEDGETHERHLENLFGYLFAKAVELRHVKKMRRERSNTNLRVSYTPDDMLNGNLQTMLAAHEKAILEDAMELGKQFSTDYLCFLNYAEVDDPSAELENALVMVQELGRDYAQRCFSHCDEG